MKYNVHVIVRGQPRHFDCDSLLPYVQYIRHLSSTVRAELLATTTVGERGCMGYNDVLQAPLQPLMDNLESSTYETFEQDPVKYAQYEEAIRRALLDMRRTLLERRGGMRGEDVTGGSDRRDHGSDGVVEGGREGDGDEEGGGEGAGGDDGPVVVMVVGAGRGPLVAASLSASTASGVPIKVYAVEKNRNAVITLRNRCRMEAWTNVEVISCDMRRWNPTVKVRCGGGQGGGDIALAASVNCIRFCNDTPH